MTTNTTPEPVKTGLTFSNKLYDKLKSVATLWLPAAGTLYFTLSQIWGLPYGEQVVGTVVAVSTFLGVGLKISTVNYNKQQVDA